MTPLTEQLSSPQNKRAEKVYELLISGDNLAGVDLVSLPEEMLARNGKSHTKGFKYSLLRSAVVAKNLGAWSALVAAGQKPNGHDIDDIFQRALAPWENWITGPMIVKAGQTEMEAKSEKSNNRLPIEWVAAAECVFPGRLQNWAEISYHLHREGVEGLKTIERCGVKITPKLINNVMHFGIDCQHSNADLVANHAPMVRYYFENGGEKLTVENCGKRLWTNDVLSIPIRIPAALAKLKAMGLDETLMPEIAQLKAPLTHAKSMPAPGHVVEIVQSREGRTL